LHAGFLVATEQSKAAPEDSGTGQIPADVGHAPAGLTRIADVPPYAVDSLVRHADALQKTAAAGPAAVYLNAALAARLGLSDGDWAVAEQEDATASLPVVIDNRIPDDCVLIPAGLHETRTLGAGFGPVIVKRVNSNVSAAMQVNDA